MEQGCVEVACEGGAEASKLPAGTTAYTLRLIVISDLVQDGLDPLTVAQISGTSVAMIERHEALSEATSPPARWRGWLSS